MLSKLNSTTRKLNGVVYTPAPVAKALVSKLLKNNDKSSIAVLEPSSGDGAFVKEIVQKGVSSENILALDIDAFAVEPLSLEC
jgi:phospholipid N-methyltransferase